MVQEQQFVARDFLGLGTMGDLKEMGDIKDGGMPLKLHEVDLGRLSGAAASVNNGMLFNSMAFTGLKHPIRSNAPTFQHFSSGNLHEEKLIEQSAESAPERSYSPLPHPMQAWWRDPVIKRSSATSNDFGPKTQVVGGFGGGLAKNAVSSLTPNSLTHAGLLEAIQRMPASEPTEKKDCAPLTIFYGGNVNVFNDITAEKAQAIMFLASTGNVQGMSSAGVANANAKNLAMASASVPSTNVVNKAIPSTNMPNVSNLPSKIQMDQQNGLNYEKSQATPNQAGFGSANMQLDLGHGHPPGVPAPSEDQPVVPTALPQARKASLARFLEKRRERVQSKSPYLLKQADSSLAEERFSSSNDVASYRPSSNTDEKKKISLPSWMERMPEYSSDIVMKEEKTIVPV